MIYIKDGAKMMRPIHSREEYMAQRGSLTQRLILGKVRRGNAKMKASLVQMNYSCLPNDDGSLKGSTRMSTTVGMDVDHIPAGEMEQTKQRILERKDELGLLMLEESARGEGFHLVFRRRPELSQEDNLRWASQLLGVEFDTGAKDITRVFFTTTEKELIFLNDEIFEVKEAPHPPKGAKGEPANANLNLNTNDNLNDGGKEFSNSQILDDNNCELDNRIRYIAQQVMKEKQLSKSVFLDKGGRHTAVKVFLAAATQLLSKEEVNSVLKELMPEHWNDQNIQQLVTDFYKNYTNPSKPLTRFQEEVFTSSQKMREQEAEESAGETTAPPAMPKKLPEVVRLLISRTPEVYQPAVAHAIFPALGAHLWKVRFPYIDNVMHEATFMNVLMAGTGAGKDCISQPINHIMADIRLRDAENLRREAEWKKEVNTRGANKDKRRRPEGLVIQEVDPDMTNPAFVMRMAEADEHFLYTKMNEIDQFDALKGSGGGMQQFQIMCLAFDPDNRYGQTRVGTQSVTEKVCIRFNWNAATTIQKGQRYFRNVLTDGPISRINFCTIPEREIGADMPVYGTYDAGFDEDLRPYIDRLCRATGVMECQQAIRLAEQLKDECADFARLSQSRVYENLSFRANVIAYLKACVLYICNDYKWSREIEDFVRWSLQYDLYCKMTFFGEAIEAANRNADGQKRQHGPRNLLELLPDEFSVHDAELMRQANGMNTRGTRNMLAQWVHRGYLLQMTDDSYVKVKNNRS